MEKVYATGVLMIGAAAMILARRWKNDPLLEPTAGVGIAGWTMIIVLFIWW